ncbi:hypothetical protein H9623_12075 [Oerskovia sp. Sa1BUA8]|uniref:Uncharacterized protein n=1 Tax=Oerskovia douganii TaxID=2762210 RepID=A0A9D5UI85_9CELL|nr:hypothetical protein [Oerskovia douganii]MBE7701037.1 hypothetical protein [Oerskovia douganii]
MNDDAVLVRATQALRRHTDHGWVATRESALLRALSAFRPSAPVRGRTAGATGTVDYVVSADVLVAALRQTVAAVPRVAPLTITCSTDDADQLTTVTIEALAAFDEPLLRLAATIRDGTVARLTEILGELAPPADAVAVDVAFTDVTDDPADL